MSTRSTLIKVSIFTLAMLLVSAGLVVVFGEFRFASNHTYHANFASASRLKGGEDVRIAGIPVGTVKRVELAYDNSVNVTFDVNKRYQIYDSTRALIRYENLVGDRYLEIASGSRRSAQTTARRHHRAEEHPAGAGPGRAAGRDAPGAQGSGRQQDQ